jgi:selenide,water dikinase
MAGIPLAGGHSIESTEPIFGLSVNGRVSKPNLLRNNGAQVGDLLYLTKPLGAGIVTAAMKRGQLVDSAHLDACVTYMSTLNKIGEDIAAHVEVHAMTDVTGFGLAGHLLEMCEASGLSARIDFSALPVYPFLDAYVAAHIYPDMTMKNYAHYASKMDQLSLQQLMDIKVTVASEKELTIKESPAVVTLITAEELKKAYRKLALEWHPDRNKSEEATGKFKENY